jgi:hypothetical protein
MKRKSANLFLRNLAVNLTAKTTAPVCQHAWFWTIRSLLQNGKWVPQRLDIFLMKNQYYIISMLIQCTQFMEKRAKSIICLNKYATIFQTTNCGKM